MSATVTLTLHPAFSVAPVRRRTFGAFVEHLGRCVYTGIHEPGHPTADADGFRGWITTIGRNRALDHLRHARRRPVVDGSVEDLVDLPDDVDVEGDTIGKVGSEAVIRLIGALPRDQAEAIMLLTVLGFDAPTAARILGKRPGAVRAAAHRGLKQLARRMTEEA